MPSAPKQRVVFSPDEIERCAARLRPQYVDVLRLADSLSYEGIAAELNIAVGTVKSRLCRARAQMNRLIEEDADANAGNA